MTRITHLTYNKHRIQNTPRDLGSRQSSVFNLKRTDGRHVRHSKYGLKFRVSCALLDETRQEVSRRRTFVPQRHQILDGRDVRNPPVMTTQIIPNRPSSGLCLCFIARALYPKPRNAIVSPDNTTSCCYNGKFDLFDTLLYGSNWKPRCTDSIGKARQTL